MSSPWSSWRRLSGVAVATACAMFGAQAEEFSWQLSGAMRQSESGVFDSDSWAIDATWYAKPIDDSDGPYALASFLNPTTRVSAAASGSDSQDVLDDPTAYTLSGAYVLPGEKWYVGAQYSKSNVDDEPPLIFSSDPKGYGVRAGRYLGANTTLEVGLGRSEQTSSLSCGPIPQLCIGVPLQIELNIDSVDLEVFHVRRFRSLTYSLEGRVSERDTDIDLRPSFLPGITSLGSDSTRQYLVAAELFPNQRLGVRLGYSQPEDFDAESYDISATWFFKPRIAVQLSLAESSIDAVIPGVGRSESVGVRFFGRL